mmetsp:Transcript_1432/g.2092  ORF Transcript_1432/g.2092 Transcript_1432/m.2092 type:complete len:255 (-) Transcript_1432:1133-1897(-)
MDSLVSQIKEKLGPPFSLNEKAHDENILKFLNWKPDASRAFERMESFEKWRLSCSYAFDAPPLLASSDPLLEKLLKAGIVLAPKDLRSKDGCCVLITRLRLNSMSENKSRPEDFARMVFYMADRVLETANGQKNGLIIFHDLSGLRLSNLDIKIPKLLLPGLVGTFPLKIQGVYVLKAPWFFKQMFKGLQFLFPSKLKSRIYFLKDLTEIYNIIERNELPQEYGGTYVHHQVSSLLWHSHTFVQATNIFVERMG